MRLVEQKIPATYVQLQDVVCALAEERKLDGKDPVLHTEQYRWVICCLAEFISGYIKYICFYYHFLMLAMMRIIEIFLCGRRVVEIFPHGQYCDCWWHKEPEHLQPWRRSSYPGFVTYSSLKKSTTDINYPLLYHFRPLVMARMEEMYHTCFRDVAELNQATQFLHENGRQRW